MELVDIALTQVLQPYFFYPAFLMVIAFASACALLKINRHWSGRWKSLLIVAPLFIPLLALCVFRPSLTISFANLGLVGPLPGKGALPGTPLSSLPFPPAGITEGALMDSMFSITGALVMIGAVLCASYLILSTAFRGRLAQRALHIVAMGPEDYGELQSDVRALAAKMNVRMPQLGLVEDLRPNAFTVGWGKGTLVVFSLGLLTMLDEDELRAVAAHELAHVKNRDVLFKTLTASLAWLSFYNPLAFMALKASQRAREDLADDRARAAIGDGDVLARAIAKVASALEGASGRSTPMGGLCFALSLVDRRTLFAVHSSSAERVERIGGAVRRRRSVRCRAGCILLSAAVILLTVVLFMNIGEVRAEIVQSIAEPPAGPIFDAFDPAAATHEVRAPGHLPVGLDIQGLSARGAAFPDSMAPGA